MQRILLILTAALCVLTACGPEAEKALEPGTSKTTVGAALRPDDPAASLSVSETSIHFEDQAPCQQLVSKSIKLFNTSSTALTVHRVSVTGAFTFDGIYDAAVNRCDTNCSVPNTPLSSTTPMLVKVKFSPLQPGNFQGTLTLHTNDPAAPSIVVALDGRATGPLIVLGQTSVAFGAHELGSTTTRNVKVMNLGNTNFTMEPSATAPFSVSGASVTVTPSAPVTLAVSFNPLTVDDLGPITGSLFLTTASVVCPAPPSATLTGEGLSPAKLYVSSNALAFEATPVNTDSVTQEVIVRNDGDGLLTVTQVKLPANSPFRVDTTGTFSLAKGGTQRLRLTFRPTGTGTWTHDLSFTINGTDVPAVSLTGSTPAVVPAKLVLSRTTMVFPQTPLNTDSASQEVTLRNEGGSALNVSQLALALGSPFRVDTSVPFSIAPGGTQRLNVTFRPTSVTSSDTLVIKSNVADQSVTLTGTAPSSPKLVLSRTAVAFGQTPFNTDSAPQEVTVRNGGDSLLTVTTLTLPQNSPFRVDTSGPFSLAPGDTQRLQLIFHPTPTSATTGKLTFTSNDATAPELNLSGTTTPGNACLGISPLSFTFAEQEAGDVGSEQKTVTVTNTGTVPMTVTPIVTTGSSAYSVSPSTAFTLAPSSAGSELFITFNPGANENGAVDGVLTFNTSPTTSCVTSVPLHGTARKTSLGVSTTTLAFLDYTVGEQPLTQQVILSNSTNWPIKVFPVSPGVLTPFTVSGIPTEGLTVAKNGGTAAVTVTFAATTSGTYSKTLQLQTDASQPVPPVTITGQALAPELFLVNNPLTLPNVAPGGESTADATLRNTGNQALFLSKVTPESDALFQVIDFLPQTVQPGAETKVKVRFRPLSSTGDLETRLRFFTTNDRQLPPVLVVRGNSNGPNAVFTATEIDFGYKQNRITHVDLSLNVSNSGTASSEPLKVTQVRILPTGTAFAVDAVTASEPELARGAKRPQPFRVTFSPNEEDKVNEASLEITYKGTVSQITTVRNFPLLGIGAEARFSTSKSNVDFPATQPGSSNTQTLDIINTGHVDVDLAEVAANLGTFNIDVIGWPNPIVPVGGSRQIEITFAPQLSGNYSANLSLATKPPATAGLVLKLSGVAAVAQLQMNPPQLVFNEVPRQTSSTQTVVLKNIGSAPLEIKNVSTAIGPFKAMLQNNPQLPVFLQRNESALLEVTFTPDAAQDVTGTVQVQSNSNDSQLQTITVSGRGTVPVLTLPGGAPEFAPQALNVEGDSKRLVVRNEGKAPLVVYTVEVPDQFCLREDTQQTTPCQSSLRPTVPGPVFTVAPGAEHFIYISAKPTQLLAIERNLTISSNADPSATLVKLLVDGVGGVSLSPSNIDFGRVNFGSFVEKTVTVTNTGITDANISVTLPPGSSEFSVQDQLPKVPANGSASVKLRFTPQGATGGLRTTKASVQVEASSQAPLELSLQGTATLARLAVTRKDAQAFDGSLDFGAVRVNTTSDAIGLRLTHALPAGSADPGTGSSTLKVEDISLDAADAQSFILQKPSLPLVLNAGNSMDVSVQFRPDTQRRFNAVLRIKSEDSQVGTMLVTLGGRGRTNQLSLSTPTLEFGARVAESSASAVRSVRLTNESLQPLSVRGLEIIGATENSEPSHFSLDSAPTLPFTLAAQESRDILVKFVPRPDVTSKANLLVVTSDIESPQAQVSLSGRGLSTVFRALNRSLDFGTVRQSEPATTKVVLTNDTSQELVLMPPKVEGPQAASFVVVSPILGAEGRALPQGDSLTLDLKYDTTQIGAAKATLVLGTKDQERAALVALSGISVASFLTIEPFELDLGWVDIGATSTPRTVTLTNQSASPARLSVVSNSNPAFEIDASALDAELAPGAQTTVGVTFRGEVGGPAEGTLKLRLRGETTAEATLTLKGQARTLGGTGGGCACGTSGDGGAALALLLLLGLGLARQGRRAQAED
ncbi:choice-of-anchor D domain-containing protein [Corallococcus sp. AB032C]|uniref:choice-of-anchor D domain-containing protein n=1 Tax=Corallococcus TaxID=83461 RepID=UPI000EEA2774|nr:MULTISPECIES: choice-of-anchor D domain-containing protein [Corallococcus]NPC46255.1 choice-of-anchor D domain-containing protein [Corallococcus exiguus]RKH83920.1 choice-of-anchor D domain-containing protein [Corallococcus sp. AB032C]